jgi:lipoprotein-releasing system ATP-binding protein
MENPIVLEAKSIFKSFYDPVKKEVLKDISFAIHRGDFVSVMGRSGCGKSSLLYILSTMDTDYTGELFIDQELVTNQSDQALASLRNEKIGFVFQFHYLLHEFSVLKNVMLPGFKLNRISQAELEQNALE